MRLGSARGPRARVSWPPPRPTASAPWLFGLVFAASLSLSLAVASPAAADRPDAPGTTALFHYAAGDVVETYGSPGGSFLIHYTRSGVNAVPAVDGDGSGVPDYVEQVATLYDDVLAFYHDDLGFLAPLDDGGLTDNGGDARFDVYLLDFGGGGSDGSFRSDGCGLDGARPGQCVGYMVQENDFVGYGYPSIDYASHVLASHEFFHAVQAAYDANQGSVIAEGTAVWATETFDPSLNDFEGFLGGFFDHTDRPIDHGLSGPVDPFSYGSAIFFKFLDERFDRSIIRSLWEGCATQPWLPALDQILTTDYGSSFGDAYTEFAQWNLYTGSYADPSVAYENGAAYPPVKTTSVTLPYASSTPLRVFYASSQYWSADPGSRAQTEAALVGDTDGLSLTLAVRHGNSVEIATGTNTDTTADTTGADEVFVIAVNTAMSGTSKRPGLCIGSPDEVDACKAAMAPAPDAGTVDAGTADAGAPDAPDAGMPNADASMDTGDAGTMTASSSGGCGCTVPGDGVPASGGPLALLLGLGALVAMRRKRR